MCGKFVFKLEFVGFFLILILMFFFKFLLEEIFCNWFVFIREIFFGIDIGICVNLLFVLFIIVFILFVGDKWEYLMFVNCWWLCIDDWCEGYVLVERFWYWCFFMLIFVVVIVGILFFWGFNMRFCWFFGVFLCVFNIMLFLLKVCFLLFFLSFCGLLGGKYVWFWYKVEGFLMGRCVFGIWGVREWKVFVEWWLCEVWNGVSEVFLWVFGWGCCVLILGLIGGVLYNFCLESFFNWWVLDIYCCWCDFFL